MSLGNMISLALRLVTHYREIERLAPQVVKVAGDIQRILPQVQLVMSQSIELANKVAPELMPAVAPPAAEQEFDAKWLQRSLNEVMGTSLVVDGRIGPLTRGVVESFQKMHSPPLVVDGWAGVQTMAHLAELVGKQEREP